MDPSERWIRVSTMAKTLTKTLGTIIRVSHFFCLELVPDTAWNMVRNQKHPMDMQEIILRQFMIRMAGMCAGGTRRPTVFSTQNSMENSTSRWNEWYDRCINAICLLLWCTISSTRMLMMSISTM